MQNPRQLHDDFTIERLYPNCREHVWAAWSIPEKKAQWFGTNTIDMDFRVGGRERSAFTNEIGNHVNETHYFEIQAGERIVFAYSMAMNDRVHTVSLATITFEDANGGTRLVFTEQMCVIPPSDGVEGRTEGWQGLLDALGTYLVEDSGRPS